MLRRYYYTIVHLKPVQIVGRIRQRIYKPNPGSNPPPPLCQANGLWQIQSWRKPTMLGPSHFCFLNKEQQLDFPSDWNASDKDKLWLYNLHYFDDINAIDSEKRCVWHETLIQRWIEENPPTNGNGWEPYPTSIRIVNWIKWQLAGHSLSNEGLQSLSTQIRWLKQRIEWHILGNHIIANAKALIFSGLLFDGQEARCWLNAGLKIIKHELPEQVLPDGGHFERSPMYHAIILEDLLDLINLTIVFPGKIDSSLVSIWKDYVGKMLCWLQIMCHPDGEISFFNDAALGVSPPLEKLSAFAIQLGINTNYPEKFHKSSTVRHLNASGYVRLQSNKAVALLDTAPIGPDYLPGHAHADTLSFELSLFGQRVIVNGGTSRYGCGDSIRMEERSTPAHNTVAINGENSSEVWGGFRVARRSYPFDLEIENRTKSAFVTCAHNGYQRLPGKPVHKREWLLAENSLEIHDRIQGTFQSAIAYFHFHPDTRIIGSTEDVWILELKSGERVKIRTARGIAHIIPGFYAPEFGIRNTSSCLAVELKRGCSEVQISWGDV